MASWIYWILIALLAAGAAGIAVWAANWRDDFGRRRWGVAGAAAGAFVLLWIIVAGDHVITRIAVAGESWKSAPIPTTVLLAMLNEPDDPAYGPVFDRYFKAPSRHAFWTFQKRQFFHWCVMMAQSQDPAHIKRGVQILGRLGRQLDGAVPVLVKRLKHPDAHIRELTCGVLAGLGPRAVDAAPALRPLLQDPDEKVRRSAAFALKAVQAEAGEVD